VLGLGLADRPQIPRDRCHPVQAISLKEIKLSAQGVGSEREAPLWPQSSASELSDWSRSLPAGGAGLHQRGAGSPDPPLEEDSEADGTFLTRPLDLATHEATQQGDAFEETSIVVVSGTMHLLNVPFTVAGTRLFFLCRSGSDALITKDRCFPGETGNAVTQISAKGMVRMAVRRRVLRPMSRRIVSSSCRR
jgi:hypothetical protein